MAIRLYDPITIWGKDTLPQNIEFFLPLNDACLKQSFNIPVPVYGYPFGGGA